VASKGTVQDALKNNAPLRAEVKREAEAEKKAEEEVDGGEGKKNHETPGLAGEARGGKLILEEEMADGHVSWQSCTQLLSYLD
jgi:hypothetical protein